MNIFSTLSSGNRDLNEENITGFLAYLLSPYEDHGFKSVFLKRFLTSVNHPLSRLTNFHLYEFSEQDDFEVEIESEYTVYTPEGLRREIDIYVRINDIRSSMIYFLGVENKIRQGAFRDNQLLEEWNGLLADISNEIEPEQMHHLTFIFISPRPSTESAELFAQFSLRVEQNASRALYQVYWNAGGDSSSVINNLRELLQLESTGMIEPVYDYTKHTLKAFVNFIVNDFRSRSNPLVEVHRQTYASLELLRNTGILLQGPNLWDQLQIMVRWVQSTFHIASENIRHSRTHLATFFVQRANRRVKAFSFTRRGVRVIYYFCRVGRRLLQKLEEEQLEFRLVYGDENCEVYLDVLDTEIGRELLKLHFAEFEGTAHANQIPNN